MQSAKGYAKKETGRSKLNLEYEDILIMKDALKPIVVSSSCELAITHVILEGHSHDINEYLPYPLYDCEEDLSTRQGVLGSDTVKSSNGVFGGANVTHPIQQSIS